MAYKKISALKNKADKLFSLKIREKGYCEWCSRKDIQMHCAHIFSRRFLTTRWNRINALCLCAGCHRKAHDEPIIFIEFVREHIGEENYNQLKKLRHQVSKIDYEELVKGLK